MKLKDIEGMCFVMILMIAASLMGCTKTVHVPKSEYKMATRQFVVAIAKRGFNAGYSTHEIDDNREIARLMWIEQVNRDLDDIWGE